MGVPIESDDKKPTQNPQALDGADDTISTGVVVSPEYDEYLRLSETFKGERLQKLVRKLDLRILPQLIFIYLLSYVDRSNVGNAKLFGAEEDMKLSSQQWNTGLSVFFVTYALGGTPSNIILKRVGPKIWLPVILTLVGLILVCSGLQSNYAGWISFRIILGLLDYTWGYRGWRFIYVIEGTFTFCIGLASFFFIYPSPAHVGGWLSPEERQFLLLRHRYSAGGETGVAEKEGFSMRYATQSFRSFHVYAITAMELTLCVVVYGISFILPTIIANLGYSAARAQALTAPPYVFACVVTVMFGYASDRFQQRMIFVVLPNLMAAVGCAIIMASVRYPHVEGVTMFGCFLMAGGLYPIPPAVTAWISINTAGSMKRSVSMALMISIGQLGGIMGSNIFIANEAPRYPVGFGICLALLVVFGILWPVVYYFILKGINARRAAIPIEEIQAKYTEEQLAEMGDESPMFRYAT
ncbi:MFS general substrate transporter [Aspergillus steynii IBT 23096]|uniref:MFS general substrate transporter n=1 Tax=Aspergillus steynii IBT 23096 TaxID=1392250 RepID=A0A2I2GMI8_9EURO|nr:MFS general substrate transporter [Aspergillus steynii IBT 23096]PLB54080.1 MFS general substrate transporter [Aspergillus steynii IBT 23096]